MHICIHLYMPSTPDRPLAKFKIRPACLCSSETSFEAQKSGNFPVGLWRSMGAGLCVRLCVWALRVVLLAGHIEA